ncbi:Ig-like domain-containing protein [Myxococcota bacterium]|nr:Ig-like domain-containing protein [Myxococcota bacterium]MBU1379735.1 Ig-like domain-containing protein [Myxococcota bacterium]MBU1496881.1 Ig-like domain-containing protein [Myxococcota bacterium]
MRFLYLTAFIAIFTLTACKGSKSDTKKTEKVPVTASIPNVVAVFPQNSATTVNADVKELKVTFSEEMDGGISFVKEKDDTFPQITGKHIWDKTRKTVTLPVKLQPGKSYLIWLNSEKFKNFKSTAGKPSAPYKWTFKTVK